MGVPNRVARLVTREVLPTVVVALVVFFFIRAWCLERYLVPTASMEPTLHGHPETGDIVLVNKLAYLFGNEPERFDLVVVRNSDDEGAAHVVKRLLGFGGEKMEIREGDVFVAPDHRSIPERLQKDPVDHADLAVSWFRWPALPVGTGEPPVDRLMGWDRTQESGGVVSLPPAAATLEELVASARPLNRLEALRKIPPRPHLAGHLGTRQQVDASFLDARGVRLGDDRTPTRDAGLRLRLTPTDGLRGLHLAFQYRQVVYSWAWSADGELRFLTDGRPDPKVAGLGLAAPALRPGEPVSVGFGLLDGRFYLVVDGVVRGLVDSGRLTGRRNVRRGMPMTLVEFAAAGAAVAIDAVEVIHDIHYSRSVTRGRQDMDAVWKVDPDQLFLLGDNTFDSRDSRSREFYAENLLGAPMLVIGPWPRTHWLSR